MGGNFMRQIIAIFRVETLLFVRDFFGFFFTFAFPVLMLLLYGSIYGNEPMSYFNGLGTMDVSVPAYSAMIIGVTGLMAFPLTISSYKEKKIYKRFDATPVGKGRVMIVQALVNFFMTVLGFALLFIVGKLVYDVQIQGHWLTIGFAVLLSIASIFSLGFFFTAIAPTTKINNLLCYISYFIMIFLSGATMPKELFPAAVIQISKFLPLTHVVNILQGTFRNAPFREYQNNIVVLIAVTTVCIIIGGILYKKKSWT